MALAGTGYKHSTLTGFQCTYSANLRDWNFQMTCSMYVVGVEGRKVLLFHVHFWLSVKHSNKISSN